MVRFQIERNVFAKFLNSPPDEQVSWYLDSCERGRIDSTLNRIVLVDVQTDRAVWEADRIDCVVVSHFVVVVRPLQFLPLQVP